VTLNVLGWEEVLLDLAADESDREIVEAVLDWVAQVAEDPDSVRFEAVPGRYHARVSPIEGTPWTMRWAVIGLPGPPAIRLLSAERRRNPMDL
jgi:hypothetical protein